MGYPGINRGGFPHSEIFGSKPVCGSPKLIAAYHVLHRLLAPRHSPYALSSLTIRTRSRKPGSRLLAAGRPKAARYRPTRYRCFAIRCRTACALSETTVCRIFSCQRAAVAFRPRRANARIGPPSRLRRFGGTPLAAFARQWRHPTRLLSRSPVSHCATERRLVENTGLEPVTSWLQTRRSPS